MGCGNGRIAIHLALRGYRVVCLDISKPLLEDGARRAKELGVADKVEFVEGDARRLSSLFGDEGFDAVLSVWTTIIGYYGDPREDIRVLQDA